MVLLDPAHSKRLHLLRTASCSAKGRFVVEALQVRNTRRKATLIEANQRCGNV